MRQTSDTHVVLIPSYNTGARVLTTVKEALHAWRPVWVVVDGSTDGSAAPLQALAGRRSDLRVLVLPRNRGKGAAILHGLRAASAAGFTHVLTMDADGQHDAASIPAFMAASAARPEALFLGAPIFDASAPRVRLRGRRISNALAAVQTLSVGITDVLCGFRVYPVAPLLAVMERSPWMRGFDFDAEAAVRLTWRGVPPVNLPTPVRYLGREEGGVSHFHYVRDNALLAWMHTRLMLGMIWRLPQLLRRGVRP